MKKINRVFILAFLAIMVVGFIAAAFFGKTHQFAMVAVSALMVWTLRSDKAEFQVKEEEEK
jgi:hypothetical protein